MNMESTSVDRSSFYGSTDPRDQIDSSANPHGNSLKRKFPPSDRSFLDDTINGDSEIVQGVIDCIWYAGDSEEFLSAWVPLAMTFFVVGLSSGTFELCHSILSSAYAKDGMPLVAIIIIGWQKATRRLYAHEELSDDEKMTFPYCKTMKNSYFRHQAITTCRCPVSLWSEISEYQGDRPIPPYLLDPKCVSTLIEDPNSWDINEISELLNLKRTLPCPTDEDKSIPTFKDNISNNNKFNFSWKSIVVKYVKENFKVSSKTSRSYVTITSKSSLDYSVSKGGKIAEVRNEVVNTFMHMNIKELIPERPESNLYDFRGILALRPSDWNGDKKLYQSLFKENNLEILEVVDKRFSHFLLLWVMLKIRDDCTFTLTGEVSESCLSTKMKPKLGTPNGPLRARVESLPEEGWKRRVITIMGLAPSILGQIARHVFDDLLISNQEFNIGMRLPSKLYKVLTGIGGWGSADMVRGKPFKKCAVGTYAESVDLSTATDCPTRTFIRDVLIGLLDGWEHPDDNFLRFCVEIALSDRDFIFGDLSTAIHRNGIMMGEGLSGVFLNITSGLTRLLAHLLHVHFPELKNERMTNAKADSFIESHIDDLQNFLDTAEAKAGKSGSNSGDDVIEFSKESLTNSFRVLYRMQGMIPSESTWYSSTRYATFTEEAAIQTSDSNGWKYLDSVKPRIFADSIDKNGSLTLSKISLLSFYTKYIPIDSKKFHRIRMLTDHLLLRSKAWTRIIKSHDVPIGMPFFIGGISHPIGWDPHYIYTLPEKDLKVIAGLSSCDPLEAMSLMGVMDDSEMNESSEEDLALLVLRNKLESLCISPILLEDPNIIYDIRELVEKQAGDKYFQTLEKQTRFASENNLISVFDSFQQLSASVNYKNSLMDNRVECANSTAYARTRSRLLKLRTHFESVDLQSYDYSELTVSKVRERILSTARQHFVRREIFSDVVNQLCLPNKNVVLSA